MTAVDFRSARFHCLCMTLIHATCVAIDGAGVLIRGPSGSGKSSLALRLMERGATLVSDDQCELTRDRDTLTAAAPAKLKGRMEIYGLGIIKVHETAPAQVSLVVDIVERGRVQRLPEQRDTEIEGVTRPWIQIDSEAADAAARVHMAVKVFRDGLLEPLS